MAGIVIQETGQNRGLQTSFPVKGHLWSRGSLQECQQKLTLAGLSSQQMLTTRVKCALRILCWVS